MALNNVKLIGFYGGDKSHCENVNFERFERWDWNKYHSKYIFKNLIKDKNLFPFKSSRLHFNLNIDTSTFLEFINLKNIEFTFSVKDEKTEYIPRELHNIILRHDIKLDNGNKFSSDQDNIYNTILNYIELSNKLSIQIQRDAEKKLGGDRSRELAELFKTGFHQTSINIYISFLEFTELMNIAGNPLIRFEVREILNEMLDIIKNIDKNPFKYSIEAFKLNYI